MKPSSGFLMRDTWHLDVVLAHRLEIAGGRHAPGHARAIVNEMLGDRLGELFLFEVNVLVSEIVTNAVRHGGADRERSVVMHLALAREVLRVEVCDQGPGFTPAATPRPQAQGGGKGLVMLDRMNSRWGVAVDDGTCVWFECDLSPGVVVPGARCALSTLGA